MSYFSKANQIFSIWTKVGSSAPKKIFEEKFHVVTTKWMKRKKKNAKMKTSNYRKNARKIMENANQARKKILFDMSQGPNKVQSTVYWAE